MWDSDRKLACDCRLICEGPVECSVDGRPGRGSMSIDASSTELDSAAVARLFSDCMLKKNIPKQGLRLGERKVSYGVI